MTDQPDQPDQPDHPGVPEPGRVEVCFVCTGNICRSPMAASVLSGLAQEALMPDGTALAEHLVISSAGTGGWHAGEPMDPRARSALEHRGYAGDDHRARSFESAWFAGTDLVVCLDRGHRQTLVGLARANAGDDRFEHRLVLLRQFDRRAGGASDVPDPYYGDDADFESCLDLVESGCRGLVPTLIDLAVRAGPDSGAKISGVLPN